MESVDSLVMQLFASEEALKVVLQDVPLVMYVAECGNATGVIYISPQIEQMLGFSREQWLQQPDLWKERLHPRDAERVLRQFQASVEAKTRFSAEYRLVARDGSTVWVDDQAQVISLDGRSFVRGSMQDITERKRAEHFQDMFMKLGERLSSARTSREAAEAIIEAADRLFGWDACFVDLYSPTDKGVHSILVRDTIDGVRTDIDLHFSPITVGSNADRTLREGSQLILRTAEELSQVNGGAFGNVQRRSASLMFVPIRRSGAHVGILSVQSYELFAYTKKDLSLLEALADFCSGAFERTFAEARTGELEQLFTAAFRGAPVGMGLLSREARWLKVNPSLCNMLGHTEMSLLLADLKTFLHPEDSQAAMEQFSNVLSGHTHASQSETRFVHRSGNVLWVVWTLTLVTQPETEAQYVVCHLLDMTARKKTEEELRYSAHYDALTGLLNRAAFRSEVHRALSKSRRHPEEQYAILFIDLDDFKSVNDRFGHSAGDLVLTEAARRLEGAVRPGDIAGRMGGDEFVLLLYHVHSESDAVAVAQRVVELFRRPFEIVRDYVVLSPSIGIALSSSAPESADDLLRKADAAMYSAKQKGKGGYAVDRSPDGLQDTHIEDSV